tara:strand:+ start:449 stop:745 length:297 start_codon:yes stop_codon:yes gene_type:complete
LNDLDICKRIARIEGIQSQIEQADTTHAYIYSEDLNSEYNPLTDDALCFKLMVKYKLSLIAPEGEQTNWDCVISDILTWDKNPNKVICLAIIEANKGK